MKTDQVLFIGGPIDGERREVPIGCKRYNSRGTIYYVRKFYDGKGINGSVDTSLVFTIMVDTSSVSSVFGKLIEHYQPQKETKENDNPKTPKQ